ncbi:MAG: GNAT family N-acetyltransferase [Candidatus Marinimicrobia bacterium]|nr:GNAT family N-acetyltransferase [Candidatus Neomarinimicrobiota bacterium]
MIHIKENRLKEAVQLSTQIPEFENLYESVEFQKRLKVKHLILTANFQEKPVGFKIGYERDDDGSFYSWMGGVLPKFRKQCVAEKLADYQERWASENGYNFIRIKTRKKHKAMIAFSLKRGFRFTGEIPKIPDKETRIWMEKTL